MKLSEVKNAIDRVEAVTFLTPERKPVPEHFHVTEVGLIRKVFIDCGGTVREETRVGFQLWVADDDDHRLSARKLKSIIEMSETKLGIDPELEVEVEYQGDTIGKYGLEFDGKAFLLMETRTDCLAKDRCGITPKIAPAGSINWSPGEEGNCAPGSGCC